VEKKRSIIIVGAGPAGLMAAEVLGTAGHSVSIYERKPSPARKFLMAGRGGLNITHSEDLDKFVGRYGAASIFLRGMIDEFNPADMRQWCADLGEETFVGSSGRVFPNSFKASPLLRSWLKRLEGLNVELHLQTIWNGWDDNGALVFSNRDGVIEEYKPDALLLALGGASWPSLGSDGTWVKILEDRGVDIKTLRPANCGFQTQWSEFFKEKFSGEPLKAISLTHHNKTVRGEMIINQNGIEGGAVYAMSSAIRGAIEQDGKASITIDLRPDLSHANLLDKLSIRKSGKSFANYLRSSLSLSPVQANLLREVYPDVSTLGPDSLASIIKSVPITLSASFDIDRAISSAGGISLDAVTDDLMVKKLPGVFAAGEMLDWEAPTGGYLLQASFATGVRAAHGIIRYLE
jgi:uncharacterized flavoprotein (TIGR03862 family)